MKTIYLAVAVFLLASATGNGQQPGDAYIASLQMPCYPPLARQARVQGTVRLKLTVAGDGRVASAEALEGSPLLAKSAVDNVRTWKFGMTEGQTLDPIVVVFDYKLEDGSSWQRCAAHVTFDSFRRVTITSNPSPAVD